MARALSDGSCGRGDRGGRWGRDPPAGGGAVRGERGEREPLGGAGARDGRPGAAASGRRPPAATDRGPAAASWRSSRRAGHDAARSCAPSWPGAGLRRLRHDLAVLPPSRQDAKKRPRTPPSRTAPDVLARRQAWFDGQTELDPERLVFIDETWARPTWRARAAAPRAASGCGWPFPHGPGRPPPWWPACAGTDRRARGCSTARSTATASAPMSAVLVADLQPGDIVVMDNLSSHKRRVREADRGRRRAAPLPSAVQPRLQPDREGLRQAQGAACARPPPEPVRPMEPPSAASSTLSPKTNAPTTSQPQAMSQNDPKML